MHHGQFPQPHRPEKEIDYQPSLSAAAELSARRQRRMFMISCVGLAALGAGVLLVKTGVFAGRALSESDVDYSARGTLDWALGMLDRPDQDLISAAGDLERVSMIYRRESALVPVFERLLDLTIANGDEHADLAGACAIRSLNRLGRPDFARAAAREIVGSGRRPLMVEALEVLRRRQNGGR